MSELCNSCKGVCLAGLQARQLEFQTGYVTGINASTPQLSKAGLKEYLRSYKEIYLDNCTSEAGRNELQQAYDNALKIYETMQSEY